MKLSIKKHLLRVFVTKKKNTQRIIITLTTDANGNISPVLKVDKSINAVAAINILNDYKMGLSNGLNRKVNGANYKATDPEKLRFARRQTIGDLI